MSAAVFLVHLFQSKFLLLVYPLILGYSCQVNLNLQEALAFTHKCLARPIIYGSILTDA